MKEKFIEGLGLFILLVSFGFQNFSEDLKEYETTTPLIMMNDNILMLSHNDTDIAKALASNDLDARIEIIRSIEERRLATWNIIMDRYKEGKKEQQSYACWYLLFYIAGSILMIIPKIVPCIRKRKKNDKL